MNNDHIPAWVVLFVGRQALEAEALRIQVQTQTQKVEQLLDKPNQAS